MKVYIVIWFPPMDVLLSSSVEALRDEIGYEVYDSIEDAAKAMSDHIEAEGVEGASQVLMSRGEPGNWEFIGLMSMASYASLVSGTKVWAVTNSVISAIKAEVEDFLTRKSQRGE